jgi:plastocyanin
LPVDGWTEEAAGASTEASRRPLPVRCIVARQTRWILLVLWVPVLGLLIPVVQPADPVRAANVAVSIVDFDFVPPAQSVALGDTVIWTNNGAAPHTSTSSTGVWNSGNLSTGQTFQFTFNTAGTFNYICTIHPFMRGSITVVDPNAPTSTPTPTVTPTITQTPTTTPTPTVTLTPIPPDLAVAVTRVGPNLLQVVITARSGQTLQRLDWTLPPNAAATALDGTSLPTGLTLPAGATSATFQLRRLSGQSVHLPIVATGSFGTWRTFVGGGPNAW